MPKLRPLSGRDLLGIFAKFGFVKFSLRGSHIKLRRDAAGRSQILTIVLHEIDKGTLHAIFRQAARYIAESELAPHFFTE
jgi:predicted RNA binding protein YcfA (HicA-like mRNA interferase family)